MNSKFWLPPTLQEQQQQKNNKCKHLRNKEWDCGCSYGCNSCKYNCQCLDCEILLSGRPYIRKAIIGLSAWLGYNNDYCNI